MDFLEVIRERGLLAQITHEAELEEHLKTGKRTAYIGFDPTAESLHVGSLMQIMLLSHWQRCGHRCIALVGGGTAQIGDPSGKSELRQMLTHDTLEHNKEKIRKQLSHFLDLNSPDKGMMLDNNDWLSKLVYLPFLREVGVHFSVNRMLTADCFRIRLEKGLTFLEFNYMLLQSYDFLHMNREFDCSVQLGGDDQWSNMLGGVDLIRRVEQKPAFCITSPLLTTFDGKKMGKTESGAVWLAAEKLSPYEYYQYWRNVEDAVVCKCLAYFTFLPMSEINRLAALQGSEINEAKKTLAFETTRLLHGEDEAKKAQETTAALFGGKGAASGTEPTLILDAARFAQDMNVLDFLHVAGVFPTKSEARRMIEAGGLALAGKKVEDIGYHVTKSDFDGDGSCLVRKGKKHYYRIRISS